jgi:hypothetical protein
VQAASITPAKPATISKDNLCLYISISPNGNNERLSFLCQLIYRGIRVFVKYAFGWFYPKSGVCEARPVRWQKQIWETACPVAYLSSFAGQAVAWALMPRKLQTML